MSKKIIMKEIRTAVADYMQSEGCACCRDCEAHEEHKKRLAVLLNVPVYEGSSAYNFSIFRTPSKDK